MKNHSPHLQIIGQLAQEYDEKYRELEKQISEISPDKHFASVERAGGPHH